MVGGEAGSGAQGDPQEPAGDRSPIGLPRPLRWVQHVPPTGGRDLVRPDLRPLPLSRPPAARQGCATKDGIAVARAGTSLVQY